MRKSQIVLSLLLLTIFSCTAPQSSFTIHPERNVNAYRYVLIIPLEYDGSKYDKFGVGNKVESVLKRKGFRIIDESRIKGLNDTEKDEILLCNIRHWHVPSAGGTSANVEITLIDNTGESVYTGNGVFQGMSIQQDLYGAVDQALLGFNSSYYGFNPSLKHKREDKFKDWETINFNKRELKNYYDVNLHSLNPIEGLWTSVEDNRYKLGIIKDTSNINRDYVAIIVATDNSLWKPKQIKIEFEKTAYPRVYTTSYYMGDHSKQGTTSFINDVGILQIELKNPDGSTLESNFIKNYPANVDADFSGEFKGSSPVETTASGSGFIISNTGLTVTNYHVIQGKSEIDIYFPIIDKTVNAKVALKDKNNDIALLSLEDFNYSDFSEKEIPFVLSSSENVKLGQNVFTLGFPLGKVLGKSAKLSTGTINSVYGIQDDPRLIQISNPIQPGNSGGPLFNSNGEIVGIVVASLNAKYFYENESIIPQNVNFAIKSNYLLNLVSMLPEDEELSKRRNLLSGKNLEDQIELITPFVVTIKAR